MEHDGHQRPVVVAVRVLISILPVFCERNASGGGGS